LQTLEVALKSVMLIMQLAIGYWQQASSKLLTASNQRYFAEKENICRDNAYLVSTPIKI